MRLGVGSSDQVGRIPDPMVPMSSFTDTTQSRPMRDVHIQISCHLAVAQDREHLKGTGDEQIIDRCSAPAEGASRRRSSCHAFCEQSRQPRRSSVVAAVWLSRIVSFFLQSRNEGAAVRRCWAECRNQAKPVCTKVDEVFDYLRDSGVKRAEITNGSEPVRFSLDGSSGMVKVPQAQVVDPMGAGDIFHGAYCYYSTQGHGFVESLEKASAIATESCRFSGTREWMKHSILLSEIQDLIDG